MSEVDIHTTYGSEVEVLQKKVAHYRKQLDAAHRISVALGAGLELPMLLREALHTALDTVDADAGSLLLYNSDRKMLVFEYVVGDTRLIGKEVDPIADSSGRAATVFRTGVTNLTRDTTDKMYNSRFDAETGYQTRSLLTVPLKDLNGISIGVMQALNKKNGQFTDEDSTLLETVSSLASTAIINTRLAKEAQLAAVARAVGDLGHDIKNALTPIETMMQTTIDAFIVPMYEDIDKSLATAAQSDSQIVNEIRLAVEPLRDWYHEAEESVKDGCEDIREMVSEIADYIKGVQSSHMVEQSLKAVVESRLRRLSVIARTRHVTITLEGLDSVPPFVFDGRLLGRALYNLINNALGAISDAVKRGEIPMKEFHIQVRARAVSGLEFPEGNYCCIEVLDDGPGISEKVRTSLFTPQAISTTPGGTGIGTRFVKSVADVHGGSVGVESVVGEGAKFWIKLPLRKS